MEVRQRVSSPNITYNATKSTASSSKNSTTTTSSENVTRAAARGTMFSFLLRILSFGFTQVTIRFVDPQTLGKASIQLDLLLNTSLFLSREGFRLSLTNSISSSHTTDAATDDNKKKDDKATELQRAVNVSWLTIPTGLLLSLLTLTFHLHRCSSFSGDMNNDGKSGDNDFRLAGILYILASFIETISEPILISCLQTLDVTTRASAEGMATTAKAITCVITLRILEYLQYKDKWNVTAFGTAQIAYAITLTTTLYYRKWNSFQYPRFIRHQSEQKPSILFIRQHFHVPTLNLTFLFTLQGIFKHCLTEGDKIVLTALSDSYDQGIYAMTLSYGSIICRCIFQPLEENARLLFARQYVLIKQNPRQKEKVQQLYQTYTTLLKLVLYIGCLFSFLGTNYTSILLRVLAGSKWSSSSSSIPSYQSAASSSLSAFCVYISTLAFNGTTEAFVYGVVDKPEDVGNLGMVHGCVGALFAIIVPVAVKMYGTIGLIFGNGICMVIRGWFAVYLASRFFTKLLDEGLQDSGKTKEPAIRMTVRHTMIKTIQNMLPHPVVLSGFITCFILTRYSLHHHSQQHNDDNHEIHRAWIVASLYHILVGITALIFLVMTPIYQYERSFGKSLSSMLREKSKHVDDDIHPKKE